MVIDTFLCLNNSMYQSAGVEDQEHELAALKAAAGVTIHALKKVLK